MFQRWVDHVCVCHKKCIPHSTCHPYQNDCGPKGNCVRSDWGYSCVCNPPTTTPTTTTTPDVYWGNNVYLVDWAENVVYMVTVRPAATREKRVSGLHGQQDLVVANVIICD